MNKHLSILAAFLCLIIVATFPLFLNITNYIPGFFSTDESYAILWNSWLNKFSAVNNLPVKNTNLISYPFGIVNSGAGYLWFFINYILALLTTPVLTYNLQLIFNMILIIAFLYFLVYYLAKNKFSAFISAVIFGFCPYFFVRSWQHLGETYLWSLPMVLLSLFLLKQNDSLKVKIFCILSFILTVINFNAVNYVIVIMSFFLVYNFTYYFIVKKNRNDASVERIGGYFKNIFIVSLISFCIVVPQFYSIVRNMVIARKSAPSGFNLYHRPFQDLFEQSAKPLSYVLPAVVHPIFGKFTEQFIGSPLYGMSVTEHTLYLGWTPLLLAFFGFKRWRLKRKHSPITTHLSPDRNREDFYIGFFVFLVIVAWLFSQPPWWNIFGFKLYMPSFFMYKILPMFRAYCRFGIVVMLAVAVLAGFGLKYVLEKFKTKKSMIGVTALFCGLVLFEFWNWPPYKIIDLSKIPTVYYWLKEQPKDIVIAEYPVDTSSPNEMYRLYQVTHEKKMINYTIPGTYANKVAQEIRRLSEPKTASILKWMGVKYAVVHKDDYLKTDLIEDKEDMEKIPKNRSLKFVKSFPPQECPDPKLMCVQKTGPIDVYEVVAPPLEPSPPK
ncbi:MAG: hypothetical protein A2Y00_08840 [Omnitrophica WOR_2 bacterium GWF2_43_52]|nr:MAG: hypothetical protein A2Y00_08840 [Omnitrophica WOR_2 bacterium GWF2_43_52]HAH20384.1 hypothetical protein [Candidatus Omnitrophota bacterium]HBG62843.1 hypothetical protein [Candidatus Omnitrophota bacterium]